MTLRAGRLGALAFVALTTVAGCTNDYDQFELGAGDGSDAGAGGKDAPPEVRDSGHDPDGFVDF